MIVLSLFIVVNGQGNIVVDPAVDTVITEPCNPMEKELNCLVKPPSDCGLDDMGNPIPLEICTNIISVPILCGDTLTTVDSVASKCYGSGCLPNSDGIIVPKPECVPMSGGPVDPVPDVVDKDTKYWIFSPFDCVPHIHNGVEIKACPVTTSENITDGLKIVTQDGCPLYYDVSMNNPEDNFPICAVQVKPIDVVVNEAIVDNCTMFDDANTETISSKICPYYKSLQTNNLQLPPMTVALTESQGNKLIDLKITDPYQCGGTITGQTTDLTATVVVNIKNSTLDKTINPTLDKTGKYSIDPKTAGIPEGLYTVTYHAYNDVAMTEKKSYQADIKYSCNPIQTPRTGANVNYLVSLLIFGLVLGILRYKVK